MTAKWVVSCTRIMCIQPLSRCSLIFPAASFFSESLFVLLLLFHHTFFLFYLWLVGHFEPSLFRKFVCFTPSLPSYILSFLPLACWPFRTFSFQKVCLFYSFSSIIHSFFSTFGLLAISNLLFSESLFVLLLLFHHTFFLFYLWLVGHFGHAVSMPD